MKEYDIYLPLHHSDGRPIDPAAIEGLKRLLTDQFGGLTHFPQENEGLWKFAGKTFRDSISILRVLADDPEQATTFFRRFKAHLEHELQQAEVLIIEREVRAVD